MLTRIIRGALMIYDLVTSKIVHQHIPTLREAAEANLARQFPSEKKIKALADANPLEKHMLTFSDADGYITAESIYVSCIYDWHLPEVEAVKLAEATLQVAYYQGVPGVSIGAAGIYGRFLPKDAVGLLTHPSDTGIYKMHHGLVDDEQFTLLEKHAVIDADGEKMISESGMRAYLAEWNKEDTRWQHEDFLFKAIGKAGNQGEFELFFSRAVSRWKEGEGYVTLKDLRNFYYDSAPTVASVKMYALPVSASSSTSSKSILDKLKNEASAYAKSVVDECPSYFPPGELSYWQNAPSSHPPLFSNSTSSIPSTCPLAIGAPVQSILLR